MDNSYIYNMPNAYILRDARYKKSMSREFRRVFTARCCKNSFTASEMLVELFLKHRRKISRYMRSIK